MIRSKQLCCQQLSIYELIATDLLLLSMWKVTLHRNLLSRKTVLFFIGMVACCISAHGQIVKTEVPYYSYGEGIGISSDDSLFLLNIHIRMQNRLIYTSEDETDLGLSELQARIQRLRLRFDGFFYDPDIIYVIQLAFSDEDISSERSDLPNMVKDAIIFYRFNEHFMLGLGKTNLPRNRQAVISSGDLQFVDRSLVSTTLGLFRNYGLQAYYYSDIQGLYYALRGAVTAGEGSNEYNSNEGLSYTGRVELLPFGKFENGGDYFEGDLEREESPKLSVGLTYHFARNTTRTGGSGSNYIYEPRDLATFMADAILKYQGLSGSVEYFTRKSDGNPVTTNQEGETGYVFVGAGQNYQLGYVFKSDFEVAARYTLVSPGQELESQSRKQQEYTLALSRYIKGHRLKIQSDCTFRVSDEASVESQASNSWQFRLQLELGF